MFKHFIITRFNLRTTYWDKTKNNESVLTDEWQQHRLQVFRDFCFPSVKNQVNQNFIWLVYFDTHSPDFIMQDIERMKSEYTNFHPIFLEEMEIIKTQVITDMQTHFNSETKFVITSRLDSDDALHKNYVREIQKRFANQNLCVIDPEAGLCFQPEPSFLISKFSTAFSPFVSLVESVTDFKTVLSKAHNQWGTINSVVKIADQILWMQLIHGKNLLNTINADEFIADKNILKEFGVDTEKYKPDFFYSLRVLLLNSKLKLKNYLRRIKKIFG